MRATNTFGIQFIIRTNKASKGLMPVYVRITVDAHRVEMSLKRKVKQEEWNRSKGRARGSREEIKSLNHYLEEVKTRLMECYQEMQLQQMYITADAIKSMFLGTDQKETTLCNLVEYHNESQKNILTKGTLKNYNTTQKYIQSFLKEHLGTTDLFLSKLSYRFITEFEYYLRKHKPKDHHKAMNNNGVMKHIERLKKMVSMALKLEWIEKDPFEKYQLKFTKSERGYLTESELTAIENKEFKIVRLQLVRDLFVFSCYTGLAYVDVVNLTPGNLVLGIDGEQWLFTNRQKTSSPVRVPLLMKAKEIIEKYKNHPQSLQKGTVFPVLSNQKTNSYLKEIADLCGIEKNLTFHLARHTFATTVTLSNGVPIETVSKMLGHTRISTTQIYAKVIERKVSEDMRALREKLEVNLMTKNIRSN